MNQYIACCGLNCESCEARLATIRGDEKLRAEVTEKWSALNGVTITPEMIFCTGCRVEGVKTPYCDSVCEIRKCVNEKHYETCADCASMDTCEKLGAILANNEEARRNLKA